MRELEIARSLARLGQEKDACRAYGLALGQDLNPDEIMEAACYILRSGGDYHISFTCLLNLYRENAFREDCFDILSMAFYEPNLPEMKKRYELNCKLLSKYPYLFRKDFIPFEDLPIRFFPYDEKGGYVPFFSMKARFGAFVNIKDSLITRSFFKNMDNPVLADDVYSQYELEYLNDSVRPSEDIARENHIYLHYTNWSTFCSWLQVLDVYRILKQKKFVFLIEDEISQYPIDFQARFGIDYSTFSVRRVKIRDVKRLIWHTQFSSSNGGDFFNEVFDSHPNLLCLPSIFQSNLEKNIEVVRSALSAYRQSSRRKRKFLDWDNPSLLQDLLHIKNLTDKDCIVATYMQRAEAMKTLDKTARIFPVMFIQPHFKNASLSFEVDQNGNTVLTTTDFEDIISSTFFRDFPYIKTFTPIRRFTTSYGSTVRFIIPQLSPEKNTEPPFTIMHDLISDRILNRNYMRDRENRLFRDSVIVRFEDGKLNPKATFTKLAEFLDVPYTESMTYCSLYGEKDPESEKGNAIGFDPVTVYKTYDDYCTDSERAFIEYFMRDAYEYYGYDFQYYDGTSVDEERIVDWVNHFDILTKHIRASLMTAGSYNADQKGLTGEDKEKWIENQINIHLKNTRSHQLGIARTLQRGLHFVNKRGQPLEMTPMLQPDPALLVQPLYH